MYYLGDVPPTGGTRVRTASQHAQHAKPPHAHHPPSLLLHTTQVLRRALDSSPIGRNEPLACLKARTMYASSLTQHCSCATAALPLQLVPPQYPTLTATVCCCAGMPRTRDSSPTLYRRPSERLMSCGAPTLATSATRPSGVRGIACGASTRRRRFHLKHLHSSCCRRPHRHGPVTSRPDAVSATTTRTAGR